MKYLFNSKGQHVANEVSGQLHATTGQNIGHFLSDYNFFIDMNGHYLGKIILENRLMFRSGNGYNSTCFGNYGNYGNVGNYANPGNHGSVGQISGYIDMSKSQIHSAIVYDLNDLTVK